MKSHIFVAIQDSNRFFALGIQYILQAYFQEKGCTWSLVPAASEIAIDLMVLAKPAGWAKQPCRLWEIPGSTLLGTIVVRENIIDRAKSAKPSEGELNVLGRREKPDALMCLLEEMYCQACLQPWESEKQSTDRYLQLTPRERQVLQWIRRELTPNQIANRLSLSVKTVSTHKLTAMRKLGFKRSSELYYWLLQGGLGQDRGL
ncbi:response regulator transcription factor [Serratia sp. (in: enterobacteria)]|uniref:helix-turn-helix transcriptional regulator n=1 Tax=Serratia sp. (in: enterobacteria) TaxID=616 RepID=UPI003989ECC4